MVPTRSISELVAGAPESAAGAPLACNANAKAAVKIGNHLNINGIRRVAPFQVIDWMRISRYPEFLPAL
jgi:hypothetical protein